VKDPTGSEHSQTEGMPIRGFTIAQTKSLCYKETHVFFRFTRVCATHYAN